MKTTRTFPGYNRLLQLLLAVLLLGPLSSYARILPHGIGIKTGLAGNGLRATPTFFLNYGGSKWSLQLGTDVQFRQMHISGVQTSFYYYPMRMNANRLRLGLYTNLHYNFSSLINKSVIAQETFLQPESRLKIDEIRLQTAEAEVGFTVWAYHGRSIATFYGVGFGYYQTLGKREDYPLIHREFMHTQLVLHVGLTLDLRKR